MYVPVIFMYDFAKWNHTHPEDSRSPGEEASDTERLRAFIEKRFASILGTMLVLQIGLIGCRRKTSKRWP